MEFHQQDKIFQIHQCYNVLLIFQNGHSSALGGQLRRCPGVVDSMEGRRPQARVEHADPYCPGRGLREDQKGQPHVRAGPMVSQGSISTLEPILPAVTGGQRLL